MKTLLRFYERFSVLSSKFQTPFLLAVRLYWGWQFAQTGWGKLHHLDKITEFFGTLNIPAPGFTAHFVSGLEFVGGVLLILGLGSRFVSLLLAGNMLVAYWTADRDALFAVFSDPGKFYVADPYTFLFASLMILIFGAGFISVDALLARRLGKGSEAMASGKLSVADEAQTIRLYSWWGRAGVPPAHPSLRAKRVRDGAVDSSQRSRRRRCCPGSVP
jgi:putative oxidoreductase